MDLTPEEERAISYPMLCGSALANAKEVQDGPKQFIVQELEDIGDDLAEGILAIDGARYLLTKFNKTVKDMKHAKDL